MIQPLALLFEVLFLKTPMIKISSPEEGFFSPTGEYISYIYKNDFTTAIIDKCIKFQNDSLKIIRIR